MVYSLRGVGLEGYMMSDLDGSPLVSLKMEGCDVEGNRVLAPSKLNHYQHEVHPFCQIESL